MNTIHVWPRRLKNFLRHLTCNSPTHLSGVWYLSKKEVAEMKKGAALAVPSPCAPLPSRPQVSAMRAVRVAWKRKGPAASYSRTGESRTTLGDGALDFRVRNGNGYDNSSMATGKKPLSWKLKGLTTRTETRGTDPTFR